MHEGNTPLYYRFGMCDASNAMLSVVAVLGALYHRKRTGEGQEVWTSLFDGGAIFTSDAHLVGGMPRRRGRTSTRSSSVSARPTACTARRTTTGSASPRSPTTEFRALCTTLGVAEIADDERFATAASRAEHRRQLESILEPRFRTKTATLLDAHPRRRGRPERGSARHARRRDPAVRLRQRRARSRRRATRTRCWATMRQFGRAHRLLRDARPRRRAPAARRPGHPRDPARARSPGPRDRRD